MLNGFDGGSQRDADHIKVPDTCDNQQGCLLTPSAAIAAGRQGSDRKAAKAA